MHYGNKIYNLNGNQIVDGCLASSAADELFSLVQSAAHRDQLDKA
jgi:hypothetical protein